MERSGKSKRVRPGLLPSVLFPILFEDDGFSQHNIIWLLFVTIVITDHLLSYFLGGETSNDTLLEADTAVERDAANGLVAENTEPNRPASQPSSSNALGRLSQNQTGMSRQDDLSYNNVGATGSSSSSQLRVHFSDDSLAAYQARQGAQRSGAKPNTMCCVGIADCSHH